ncbi:DUF115 domain-containing protein [Butyrivibrio sp. DSM 10294]|uniref:motility associated factor glycosyltransferase family protein n=1 Tax=Butyrivibrio sp. DSM 10294 TaxID=2972457 RepID=UPI00234FACD1|nr:6-hydroxymethylpterin diphosphokinase MptE-like protein [Butyrivibrio sp. DSM 10294]MDC7293597.1 DUF115 domain-containing protein [Butyrivibrio sp. DSM 10294]
MDYIELRAKMIDLEHECAYCAMCLRLERLVSAFDSVKKITTGITDILSDLAQCGNEYSPESFMIKISPMLNSVITYQKSNNFSLLADVLEVELSALISDWIIDTTEAYKIEHIDYFDKNIDALFQCGQKEVAQLLRGSTFPDTHFISPIVAGSGDIVFSFESKAEQKIIAGLVNPYRDALQYAFYNCEVEKLEYSLTGFEMIYEAMAIIRMNYGVPVTICESDIVHARQVLTYLDLSRFIASNRLLFVVGEVRSALSDAIVKGTLLTKAESISAFSSDVKELLTKYRALMLPIKENSQLLAFNFHKNIELDDPCVTEISNRFRDKEIYMVAGGPSLSPCMPLLEKRTENSLILCVGTSAGKLANQGIDPDFIVLIDGLPATRKQLMHDFDYKKTEFIYLATAYYETVKLFGGKRYIVYQNEYELSENMATEKSLPLFKTGGSVSTLALDLAVKLGAKKVTCFGLDLAYTYNQFHASGISDNNDVEAEQGKIILKSTSGGEVRTASNLASYHDWIEKYIASTDNLPELVNISDGSYIKGMKNITVSEALKMM